MGLVPDQETKITHAVGQLSLHITTREGRVPGGNEDPAQPKKNFYM